MTEETMRRCAWASGGDPLMLAYHDDEWGVASHDERHLFEMLTLEGAQAGLSWATILRKHEGYRDAFEGWDVERIAAFGAAKVEALMANSAIVRNRAKIEATITNARATLQLYEAHDSLDSLLWSFVGGKALQYDWRDHADMPSETPESRAMSKELKRRGFKFVGSTICYAFMQAVGVVNDHTAECFRYRQLLVNSS